MLEFLANKPIETLELEISFDEAGARQLIERIEACFKTGHEHLLPLGNDSRWSLTVSGPNSFQVVTLYLDRAQNDQSESSK